MTAIAERLSRLDAVVSDPTTMDVLCARLQEGESVRDVARSWDVPHGRLSAWILADRERSEQYLRALEIASHVLVSECVPIADGADPAAVNHAKLRIDTRFRIASAHAALYADKKTGGVGTSVTVLVQRERPAMPPLDLQLTEQLTDQTTTETA